MQEPVLAVEAVVLLWLMGEIVMELNNTTDSLGTYLNLELGVST